LKKKSDLIQIINNYCVENKHDLIEWTHSDNLIFFLIFFFTLAAQNYWKALKDINLIFFSRQTQLNIVENEK